METEGTEGDYRQRTVEKGQNERKTGTEIRREGKQGG